MSMFSGVGHSPSFLALVAARRDRPLAADELAALRDAERAGLQRFPRGFRRAGASVSESPVHRARLVHGLCDRGYMIREGMRAVLLPKGYEALRAPLPAARPFCEPEGDRL